MLHLARASNGESHVGGRIKADCGAIDESINLYAFAPTREDLADEIAEHLVFLWRSYALEDVSKLSPKAKLLRVALLARIQGSVHASGDKAGYERSGYAVRVSERMKLIIIASFSIPMMV